MLFKNDTEFVEINIFGRTHPNSNNYWDSNWLSTEIIVSVHGFKADYCTCLRAEELHVFYDELIQLYDYKIKEVKFTTLEAGIYLKFRSQTNGTFDCEGIAIANYGVKIA